MASYRDKQQLRVPTYLDAYFTLYNNLAENPVPPETCKSDIW